MMPDEAQRERLEKVKARITPEIQEAIRAAAARGKLPGPIQEAVSAEHVAALGHDGVALEATMPVPALEAIVQRFGRPPLLIENDEVVLEPLPDFPPATDAKLKGLDRWIPSVGRVEFLNHEMSWGGTGWVVDAKNGSYLVVTNRHVAGLVAQRTASGKAVFMRSPAGPRYGARVDFKEEALSQANDDSRTVAVSDIAYLADDLSADMALLRLGSSPFDISPVVLSDRSRRSAI